MNQDQLTKELNFDKATTARSVKHLEEEGYIERKVDGSDRRSSRLYPTKKGIDFQSLLQETLASVNSRLAEGLTREEVDHLLKLLEKVFENSSGEV